MYEYSMFMGNYIAKVADIDRAWFNQHITAYMQEKKLNYVGLAYLEQLEKNYVYHERSAVAMVDNINMLLLGQTKAPRKKDIELRLNEIRLTRHDESLAHIRYLALGCDGCEHHSDHAKYGNLRQLRLKDMNGYLDEMEFGCKFYKTAAVLSQGCLISLWKEPNQLFGGSFYWDKRKMDDMLYQYIKFATSAILNNTALRDDEGKLLNFIVFD